MRAEGARLTVRSGLPSFRHVRAIVMTHNPAIKTPTRGAPPKTRRRYSRGQRWTIRILVLLVLAAATLVALTFLADFQMEDAGPMPSLAAGDGVYLIVGSDSRENLPDDLEGSFGDFAGAPPTSSSWPRWWMGGDSCCRYLATSESRYLEKE